MRQEEIIKRYVTKINKEINRCGTGSPRLISLKILYPSNTQRTELQPLLALCDGISHDKYVDFENKYVNQSDGTLRSLSFLNYNEAIRLNPIANGKNDCNLTNNYGYYAEPLVSVDPLKLGKDNTKVEEYWTAWQNDIATNFQNGKSTLWSYVVVPRQIEENKDPVEFTASAFLIFSDIVCEKTGIIINKYCQDLLIECITSHFYDDIKLQATKSAINEIINRNMAHHITSHVSNRATLDKILERLGYDTDDKRVAFLNNKNNYYTILDLLNRFNQYRDERSEYLTYITNFSSPSSAYFFQDVILPFVENTLLMDNIAANENINYEKADASTNNRLRIKVYLKELQGSYKPLFGTYVKRNKHTGEISAELYCTENLPYFRLKYTESEYPYDDCVLALDDIEVSLPGTLGKHALYSILENFIRNSAKHGSYIKNIEGLDIFLLLEDKNDSIEVILTDNCSDIKDENGKIKISIEAFNNSIRTPILERKELGLIDMKVNACLLAGEMLSDENCMREDVFKAREYRGKLAYQFRIAKPKKAVFIGEFAKDIISRNGFYYFQTMEDYSISDISKSFKFAVLSDDLYEHHKATISSELPARVLKVSNIDINKVEILEHLYEAWLKKLRGIEKSNVHLFFEQDKQTAPTEEFKTKYASTSNLKVYSNEDLNTGLTIADDKNIFFDRHGGLISKLSNEKSLVDINNAWILIDKNNPDFDYISRYDIENKTNLLGYELEEAGLLKVLIVDERVAEQSVRVIADPNLIKIAGDSLVSRNLIQIHP
jgi:hypothetical protein